MLGRFSRLSGARSAATRLYQPRPLATGPRPALRRSEPAVPTYKTLANSVIATLGHTPPRDPGEYKISVFRSGRVCAVVPNPYPEIAVPENLRASGDPQRSFIHLINQNEWLQLLRARAYPRRPRGVSQEEHNRLMGEAQTALLAEIDAHFKGDLGPEYQGLCCSEHFGGAAYYLAVHWPAAYNLRDKLGLNLDFNLILPLAARGEINYLACKPHFFVDNGIFQTPGSIPDLDYSTLTTALHLNDPPEARRRALLPRHAELLNIWRDIPRGGHAQIVAFLREREIDEIYCEEFVDGLTELLRERGVTTATPVLEMGAGNGRLTQLLRAQGYNVIAIDHEGKTRAPFVQAMTLMEACERYEPQVVIAHDLPSDSTDNSTALRFPTVDLYLQLGRKQNNGSSLVFHEPHWKYAEHGALADVYLRTADFTGAADQRSGVMVFDRVRPKPPGPPPPEPMYYPGIQELVADVLRLNDALLKKDGEAAPNGRYLTFLKHCDGNPFRLAWLGIKTCDSQSVVDQVGQCLKPHNKFIRRHGKRKIGKSARDIVASKFFEALEREHAWVQDVIARGIPELGFPAQDTKAPTWGVFMRMVSQCFNLQTVINDEKREALYEALEPEQQTRYREIKKAYLDI